MKYMINRLKLQFYPLFFSPMGHPNSDGGRRVRHAGRHRRLRHRVHRRLLRVRPHVGGAAAASPRHEQGRNILIFGQFSADKS